MAFTTGSPSRSFVQQQSSPKIRAACEACHQRKIRCQMAPAGNVCQACDFGGRKCFFTLRAKAGRPRRTRSHLSGCSLPSPEPSPQSDDNENWLHKKSKETSSVPDAMLNFDWTNLNQAESSDFSNTEYSSILPDFHTTFQIGGPGQHVMTPREASLGMLQAESPDVPSEPLSWPSTQESHSTIVGFATVLQTCTGLHQMHQSIRRLCTKDNEAVSISGSNLQSVLQSLDTVGECLVDWVGQICGNETDISFSDSALITLIMATLFKMLEVCDLLIQNRTDKVQTLSQVQLLKRIDFNIVQGRTALRQLVQSHQLPANIAVEVSSLASQLHHRIKVGLNALPGEWGISL